MIAANLHFIVDDFDNFLSNSRDVSGSETLKKVSVKAVLRLFCEFRRVRGIWHHERSTRDDVVSTRYVMYSRKPEI